MCGWRSVQSIYWRATLNASSTFRGRRCGLKSKSSRPSVGEDPVPPLKAQQFYYESRKFDAADLTAMDSELLQPARIQECLVHLEARVRATHELGGEKLRQIGGAAAVEVEILRVHVATHLIPRENYIDPAMVAPDLQLLPLLSASRERTREDLPSPGLNTAPTPQDGTAAASRA